VKRFDIATFLGLIVAFGGILVGNAIEGGHLSSIIQPTAAMIVFGGTIGAVLVSYPMSVVMAGVKAIPQLFTNRGADARALLDEIVRYAQKARKEGIISLEAEAKNATDPFLRRAIVMAVDGVDSKTMRETLELELSEMDTHGELAAKTFESAGGYAPTVGILGAVLGLIHVMQNLSDVSKVGEGIAVAFVATIYGVGAANLVFLPAAGKIKVKHHAEMLLREMMMHGAVAIQEGQNPKLIEERLSAFVHDKHGKKDKGKAPTAAKPRAVA
jgi:chemotaxis protein MotA